MIVKTNRSIVREEVWEVYHNQNKYIKDKQIINLIQLHQLFAQQIEQNKKAEENIFSKC